VDHVRSGLTDIDCHSGQTIQVRNKANETPTKRMRCDYVRKPHSAAADSADTVTTQNSAAATSPALLLVEIVSSAAAAVAFDFGTWSAEMHLMSLT
jgi:hypothetical protein